MMILFKNAWRTLVRNPRRTGITVLSIAVSLAILYWIQSVMEARTVYLVDKVLSLSGGDIQVYDQNYYKDKRLSDVLKGPVPDLSAIVGSDAIRTDRIRLPGLIAAAEESFPIFLNGIDPEQEAKITKLKQYLTKGDFLKPDLEGSCADRPVYIGEKLANLLRIKIGDKVVFLGQAADGTLGNELLRVVGLFESSSPDYDKAFAFTTLSCTRKIGVLTGVHETAIRMKDSRKIDEIVAKISEVLPVEMVAIGWKQANPMVAQVLKFNDGMIALLTTILVTIVIFGTVNTLLMSVNERSKEFGVMLALGMQSRQLMITIVIEAFIIAMAGLFIGLILGTLVILYHQWQGFDLGWFVGRNTVFQGYKLESTIVYPIFALVGFLKAAGFMVVFVTLAGVFPAYRAGKLTPVDTIRG